MGDLERAADHLARQYLIMALDILEMRGRRGGIGVREEGESDGFVVVLF